MCTLDFLLPGGTTIQSNPHNKKEVIWLSAFFEIPNKREAYVIVVFSAVSVTWRSWTGNTWSMPPGGDCEGGRRLVSLPYLHVILAINPCDKLELYQLTCLQGKSSFDRKITHINHLTKALMNGMPPPFPNLSPPTTTTSLPSSWLILGLR